LQEITGSSSNDQRIAHAFDNKGDELEGDKGGDFMNDSVEQDKTFGLSCRRLPRGAHQMITVLLMHSTIKGMN